MKLLAIEDIKNLHEYELERPRLSSAGHRGEEEAPDPARTFDDAAL
jgi:hypothetical protein